MKSIILFPNSGNAREAIHCIEQVNKILPQWNVLGLIDDDSTQQGGSVLGYRVHSRALLDEHPEASVLAVPGSPDSYSRRAAIITSLNVDVSRWAKIIHPAADIARTADIGHNTLIMAHTVIGPAATIGNHCVILPNSVISHDASVRDYCCIGSNVSLSGSVRIGVGAYIGSGAKIKENIEIGEKALVGLGSVVIQDVKAGTTVAGNPAKQLVTRQNPIPHPAPAAPPEAPSKR